jgi:hypothetical protein
MENSKNRIPKTIRLNPAIDKNISKYCLLSGNSQADYINKILAEDLDKRTLQRFAFNEELFVNLPVTAESIADCIDNEIDLRKYNENDKSMIGIKINNFLDLWNGETFAKPNFNYLHSGINIIDFNDAIYYIFTEFYFDKYSIMASNEKTKNLFNTANAEDLDKVSQNIVYAPYIFDAEKVFIDKVILISKEDAIDYAYLSKNSALIDALKNNDFSNDNEIFNNPASNIVELKQMALGRELENTKNQLREAERMCKEQKEIVKSLSEEIETLKKQNNQLIEDNSKLDIAIADAVNVGYEKAKKDFQKEFRKLFNDILIENNINLDDR